VIRKNEVHILEALAMLDVPETVLGTLAEQGKIRVRRADGNVYFLREEIEELIHLQSQEVRSVEISADDPEEAKAL
jgi:hypothetical protein